MRALTVKGWSVVAALLGVATPASANAAEVWTELQRVAPDADALDLFARGASDMSGTTVLVGVPGDDTSAADAGVVHVYEHDGMSLGTPTVLTASDAAEGDTFGFSGAIDGDIMVIGAPGAASEGSAYVFERVDDNWIERSILAPATGTVGDRFGYSVSVSGDTVVVGAESSSTFVADGGAVSIYERNGDAWELSTEVGTSTVAGAQFGYSVSLDGDTLAVGAIRFTSMAVGNAGALFVYDRDGGNWTETFSFAPEIAAHVGRSVSVDGDTIAVGAPRTRPPDSGQQNVGTVYVFVDDGGWQQQAAVEANMPMSTNWFGREVDVRGDRLLVAVPNREGPEGNNQGALYHFTREDDVWTQESFTLGSEPFSGAFFGGRPAFDGEFAVVGSRLGAGSGAAYLLRLQRTDGDRCAETVQCVSGFCVDGVCCDSACGDGDDADCQACSAAAGAAEDGVCGPVAADTVCRPSARACDVEEVCDGRATACPDDESAADDTPCDDGDRCTVGDVCEAGVCSPGADECGGTEGAGTTSGGGDSDGSSEGTEGDSISGGSDSDSDSGTSTGGPPIETEPGSSGESGGNTDLDDDGSFVNCECRSSGRGGGAPASAFMLAVLLGLRRRRR